MTPEQREAIRKGMATANSGVLQEWLAVTLSALEDAERERNAPRPANRCRTFACNSGAQDGECWYCPRCMERQAAEVEARGWEKGLREALELVSHATAVHVAFERIQAALRARAGETGGGR